MRTVNKYMDMPAIAGGRPVRGETLPYARQLIEEDDIASVVKVLQSDFLTTGPAVDAFEHAFAEYVGARYAVAMSSGTAALHGAMFAAGIEKGDEVVTTPITFAATANSVIYQGGTPVFADIEPDTLNISVAEIEKRITSRTKVILPVHFTGRPCAMDEILGLARKHNLLVVEDAAHALGAEYRGKKIGLWGDMTVFSLHPVKHITTGEGGVITTSSEELYEKLLLFRNHGLTRDKRKWTQDGGPWYYEMLDLGYNYRLTDIQCALGQSQLKKMERFLARREEIVRYYNKELAGCDLIKTPPGGGQDIRPAWHLYVIRVDLGMIRVTRREVFEALRAENIGVNVHYLPVYRHPYYSRQDHYRNCSEKCPVAGEIYEQIISLPLFCGMSNDDAQDVVSAVRRVLNYYRK